MVYESKDALKYYEEHDSKLTEYFKEMLDEFEELRFFTSVDDQDPYLAIVFRSDYPHKAGSSEVDLLEGMMDGLLQSYVAVPHQPDRLEDIFKFVVVKKSSDEASGYEKLIWADGVVAPRNEFGGQQVNGGH
ncbi:hypothetical protein F5Y05DRAFT_412369 [Hypoxylon sp. FL0543]|nr:hypothetical protein F5Y05DRAFT_412369 [Hypoxylon sp. FL0543]